MYNRAPTTPRLRPRPYNMRHAHATPQAPRPGRSGMQAAAEDSRLLRSIPAARVALIERIARSASGGVGRSGLRQRFLRNYFHGVGEEDLAERTPRQLARAALAHLEF